MKVALYARVSTADKDQEPQTQLLGLREYSERQGWMIGGVYVDRAPAGDHAQRTEWAALLGSASRKMFDIVLVDRVDRAFRSVLDAAATLQQLRGWDVGFRSYREPYIDTTTPFGEALFHITAAWAQLEREILRERVKAGMTRARSEGRHVGRPRVIDAVDVDLVKRMRGQGLHWRSISRVLKVSESTLRRAVRGNAIPR